MTNNNNIFMTQPFIGVFDSGIGGLTVLHQLQKTYPTYNFVYVADSANLPYGDKTKSQLLAILQQNLQRFKHAQAIIIACNTLSCIVDQIDTSEYPPIINMVDCLTEQVINTKPKSLAILATTFTTKSQKYESNFQKLLPSMTTHSIAASKLVPALESNCDNLSLILEEYMDQITSEYLLLGCTHYNSLIPMISHKYPHIKIISPYQQIIKKINNFPNQEGIVQYYTTKYTAGFQEIAERIINTPITLTLI